MEQTNDLDRMLQKIVRVMLMLLAFGILALMFILLQTPIGAIWRNLFDVLFALNNTQVTWFITRASGIVAYLLLWLSTVWGLGVSAKFFDRLIPRAFTYDAHEYISLLAIGFTIIHIVILLWDQFMPFNLPQLFIPFISDYRPFWIGIGILGTYVTLLVTITFYLRKWIGIPAFRAIHLFSFLAYFGVTLHSWFSGTDTNFAIVRWMYLMTAFIFVAMALLWWFTRRATISTTPAPAVNPPMAELELPSLSPKTMDARYIRPK